MSLIKIALAGEGGQGVQSVAEILAEAAYNENKQTIYIPNFGLEQRGGVSIAFIQVSDKRIGAPKFSKADVVVALSERAIGRTAGYSDMNTLFVYDSGFMVKPEELPREAKKIIGIPAVDTANRQLHPKVFNIIIMGTVIGLTNVVSFEAAKEALESKLAYKFEKNPDLRELNFKALAIGKEMAEQSLKEGVGSNA
ncbi:MAG: 2-oxoacid:acceptor oxidoreductase family protein [Syntrophomonas sp.]|uniref:2-oxoacid:acceptor oxidoreductase family protein n=1 Tax=Syntrophomonas sp. TaxID=2053627 RepID=UPI0026041DBD|nr:2-oxoacid:acceptor oxidoreductase family protein [Syntrophomonas sp.]MDD2511195.1 2-oxoacid:acceptor oxidoreductase family protein [Syntrophomonas sp.]MDD3878641.1 2-oxoacid:acceptor oxidoreductase family protein [Syntrophomonas sp.]MDD4627137.1 2-oxoacid:acceptor oxidoreductase family protein [Syntrophomonas sp.]